MVDAPAGLVASLLEYRFQHIEHAPDRLVVRRVNADRPLVLREDTDSRCKLFLHLSGKLGPRRQKVFVIPGRPDQVLAGTFCNVAAEPRHGRINVEFFLDSPSLYVLQLGPRLLGKQVVRNPKREARPARQGITRLVVRGIHAPAPAWIDDTGEAEAIQFPVVMLRRVDLFVRRQLWKLRDSRVENRRTRFRMQDGAASGDELVAPTRRRHTLGVKSARRRRRPGSAAPGCRETGRTRAYPAMPR